MKYGQGVRVANHPRYSGHFGVIVKKSGKGYLVSLNKSTKIVCMSFQLVLMHEDGTELCDRDELFQELNWKPAPIH